MASRPFRSAGVRLTILLCGAALSACSGAASLSSPGVTPSQSHGVTPLAGAAASSTPIPFSYQTVDDPTSNVNKVTGINNSSEIVGNVGAGTASSPIESYSSTPPYNSFQAIDYSSALGTVITSLSSASSPALAGYIISPPQLRGIWGAVQIKGLFSLLKDRKEGPGNDSVTEILGINNSEFAAGFYTNASGVNVPFVLDVPTTKFTQLKPPGSTGAEATGINKVNDISGWESTSAGTVGFFVRVGSYYVLTYPSAATTEALGLNTQDQIVGYYQGASGVKHGFVLTNPTGGSQQVWQTIDVPNAVNGTVVTSINDNDDISGYYVDGSGVQHGFVAVP
jgi:hypothetical protein